LLMISAVLPVFVVWAHMATTVADGDGGVTEMVVVDNGVGSGGDGSGVGVRFTSADLMTAITSSM
jgi:hypothetical protein